MWLAVDLFGTLFGMFTLKLLYLVLITWKNISYIRGRIDKDPQL